MSDLLPRRSLASLLLGALVLATSALPTSPALAQWTRRLELAHGAFDQPRGIPEAVVHAPPTFDARGPLRLVVFLHGYRGCADVLAASGPARCRPGAREQPGWDLLARHDEAGTSTLFVIAQLALDVRDGSPGRFARAGGFRAFVDELLGSLDRELGARRTSADLASITLVAHSAAFESALLILRAGSTPITNVVLLDALYSGGPAFLAWALADPARRLVSMHAGAGTTAERNRDLARRARRALGGAFLEATDLAALQPGHRVAVIRVRTPHAELPARHLADALRALQRPEPADDPRAHTDAPRAAQRR